MTTNRHASDVDARRLGARRAPIPEPVPTKRRRHAAAFVEAAVALGADGRDAVGDTEERRRLRRAAGDALVRLAELGATAALAEVLRPDPAEGEVTYTVACYQIGDLVPCALRDLRDPAEAVRLLASCAEASHVAAELLASTPAGLRWSALARTGEDVTYRPADDETTSAPSPEVRAAALERWAVRLAAWARRAADEASGAGLLGEAPHGTGAAGETSAAGEAGALGGTVGEIGAILAELVAAVYGLEGHLSSQDDLVGQLQGRLAAIEQRLARIEQRTGLAAGRAELDPASW